MKVFPNRRIAVVGLASAALLATSFTLASTTATAGPSDKPPMVRAEPVDEGMAWSARPSATRLQLKRVESGRSVAAAYSMELSGRTGDLRRGYLKYQVNVPTGATVTCAVLSLEANRWNHATRRYDRQPTLNVDVSQVSNNWNGTTLNWSNRVPVDVITGRIGARHDSGYATEVTSAIKGTGTYSFAFQSRDDMVTSVQSVDPGYETTPDKPHLTVSYRYGAAGPDKRDCYGDYLFGAQYSPQHDLRNIPRYEWTTQDFIDVQSGHSIG